MQVKQLKIDNHKSLVDFDISFQQTEGGSSTILIGENGTGKSTFLGDLLTILMSFDSGNVEKQINYNYELTYSHSGSLIKIAQVDKNYQIEIDNQITCKGKRETILKQLNKLNLNIFPSRVVYFYSGANDHELPVLNMINSTFVKECKKTLKDYDNALDTGVSPENHFIFPRRKYIYSDEELVNIYALSMLAGSDSFESHYLEKYSNLNRVDHIDFSILLSDLSHLFPFDFTDNDALCDSMRKFVEFTDSHFIDAINFVYTDTKRAYFTVKNIEALNIDSISLYNFFDKIHSILNGEFQVYVAFHDKIVDCNYLSEGQRQLIKILGMLGICKSEDCLVLMDEPDAHMNPRWKYDLKTTIDGSLQEAINTQALIATHDPLVINGVDKDFIRIFTYNQSIFETNHLYVTKIIEPQEDTAGLGIDGLLQSEYYGLATSYDKKSTDKFIRRQTLYSKLINQEITDEEKQELRDLTREIGSMPISSNSIDFLYDDFIRVFRNSDLYSKEYLSYDQIIERREKIKKIISELYEEQA